VFFRFLERVSKLKSLHKMKAQRCQCKISPIPVRNLETSNK